MNFRKFTTLIAIGSLSVGCERRVEVARDVVSSAAQEVIPDAGMRSPNREQDAELEEESERGALDFPEDFEFEEEFEDDSDEDEEMEGESEDNESNDD